MRAAALLAALALSLPCAAAAPRTAHAATAMGALSEAQAHLNSGDYYQTRELTEPLLDDESLPRGDRAEALRLNGLAKFFLGDRAGAEEALFEYLCMEPHAHLDPALVPPVGIAFFEDVRTRRWSEIRLFVPKPKRRGYAIVNILPPFGQFQNGDRAKGWALGASELLLAATAMTTFVILRDLCDETDDTCTPEGTAKVLQKVNLASVALLGGVWLYGAIDGYLGWHRQEEAAGGSATVAERPSGGITLGLATGGATIVWFGSF